MSDGTSNRDRSEREGPDEYDRLASIKDNMASAAISWSGWVCQDMYWLVAEVERLRASRSGESPRASREMRYQKALEEIAEGSGRFSRDPQQFATNVIENLTGTAQRALTGEDEGPGKDGGPRGDTPLDEIRSEHRQQARHPKVPASPGESPREPSEEGVSEAARAWRYSDEQSTEERMREAICAYLRSGSPPASGAAPESDEARLAARDMGRALSALRLEVAGEIVNDLHMKFEAYRAALRSPVSAGTPTGFGPTMHENACRCAECLEAFPDKRAEVGPPSPFTLGFQAGWRAALSAGTPPEGGEPEEDAARFRWLCDEQGFGFTYRGKNYGMSVAKWGDWPDDERLAIDAARAALSAPGEGTQEAMETLDRMAEDTRRGMERVAEIKQRFGLGSVPGEGA